MGSRAFLTKLLLDIRASYWFLPSSLVCLAAVLAQLTLALDAQPELLPFTLPAALRDTQVTGARSVMAIVSQSVFGVAGVMFSMTIVAVSFASGNFGPRLIGNFMRDRGNQWSLGILVATFVYALSVTRAIQSPTDAAPGLQGDLFVPHLSIATALTLTVLSIFTVIYFVHHIPETINVSNITARLGRRLIAGLKAHIDAQQDGEGDHGPDYPETPPDARVTLDEAGYVQTLNTTTLGHLAETHGLILEVARPIGTFVTEDTVVLHVWGENADPEVCASLRSGFALGPGRTEDQNLLFVVDQLVEMIARAMSPGVNDPFTAINCLNWLHAAALVAANHGTGLRAATGGRVRLHPLRFEDILQHGFANARPYTRSDPLCDAHMTRMFSEMKAQIRSEGHRETLRRFVARMEAPAQP
ncbi:MAG: DUF2254 domain-containing protein [Rhodobacteraceae bacterium]|nr:DUF2254 domain-containing protein [Paracoccaceae bacterium]